MKNKLSKAYKNILSKINTPIGQFIIFSIIGAVIYFLRFPNNFIEPNFYAEDGTIFENNIKNNGFLSALFSTFNGYYVIGIYILEGLGHIINFVFYQGQYTELPRCFAITSYIFLGIISALPFLLFKKYIKLYPLLLIFLFSVFIPLPGYDYAVIGTIGNSKFIFVYLAFLLIIYRNIIPESSSIIKFIAIDISLLICAYTNLTVYFLMLFTLIRYIPEIKKINIKKLLKMNSFRILIFTILAMLPQLILIKLNGIPKIPGYLDSPYQISSTIDIFLFRTLLFPFFGVLTKYFNDILTIFIFIIFIVFLCYLLKKKKDILVFGLSSAIGMTLIFVIGRTGVWTLINYSSSGPDHFFYAQNLIICFLVGIAIGTLFDKLRNNFKLILSMLLVLFFIFIYIPHAGSYGKNNFMQRNVKNIYINAQSSCNSTSKVISINSYPVINESMQINNLNRADICTDYIKNYSPATEYLDIETEVNSYIPDIIKTPFKQTFQADYSNLNGISILVLTYQQKIQDGYLFKLYDNTCSKLISTTKIYGSELKDSTYSDIYFPKITKSKDKTYCFSIEINTTESTAIALPLSKTNQYKKGILMVNSLGRQDDLVFDLHYAN